MTKERYYYHATDMRNLGSILSEGLKTGPDGIVYLTDTPQNALKFVMLRMVPEILVVAVKESSLDKELLEESFDHSQEFFKCRAWGYMGSIESDILENYRKYINPLTTME